MRRTGVVKWFHTEKGYGFIVDDETNKDIFVHYKSVMAEGFKNLTEGQVVQFSQVETPKGLKAEKVTVDSV